ncbi:tyrosine-type recombinase/integrase [Endozoicomonas arenosclerae]|uniref:tyrosine-type recombinase/integrase n=1 Tax=Endozoicomonas arenosclerae TaxID=1633495 RepID=UPI0007861C80|nr:tyrosine-type recombinase/integrase [Endozoicomonas arenosclerae]
MGRKKSNGLPPNVFLQGKRFVYWPYLGCVNGKPKRGQQTVLCGENTPIYQVWVEYKKVIESNDRTIEWLLGEYIKSDEFKQLAQKTQEMRKVYFPKICEAKGNSGHKFGKCPLERLTPPLIKKYLLTVSGNATRNKHKGFMAAAWTWAVGEFEGIPDSPFSKLKLTFKEGSRQEAYVTDEVYSKVYELMRPMYQAAMEIAYLCRAREGEVLALKPDDLLEEGILLQRTKGSVTELTRWSPRLRDAVELLLRACNNQEATTLFHDPDGSPIKPQTFSNRFRKAMNRHLDNGRISIEEKFVFHDLKAKGVSDHTENYSGHKTLAAKTVYLRTAVKIDSTR